MKFKSCVRCVGPLPKEKKRWEGVDFCLTCFAVISKRESPANRDGAVMWALRSKVSDLAFWLKALKKTDRSPGQQVKESREAYSKRLAKRNQAKKAKTKAEMNLNKFIIKHAQLIDIRNYVVDAES